MFAGDVVPRKKPAPAIYQLAVEPAGAPTRTRRIVVEDSRNGMVAALGAGLTCVVTTCSYTRDEDFTGAALVVSSLGEPESRAASPAEVLADPYDVLSRTFVDLGTLEALLQRASRSPHSKDRVHEH